MSKLKLNHIIKQLNIGLLNPIPMVHQTESSECGLACLAMICGYHGKNIDLIALRRQFNLSSRGTNLHGLHAIAEELGLTTRVFSLDLNEIFQLKTPCMLHWNFNHFVVLARSKKNKFVIHDPAQGRRTVGEKEISQCFTGVALEAWPSSKFVVEEVRSRISLKLLFSNIQGLKGALLKIFCLSIVIESITIAMPVGTQLVIDHALPAADSGLLTLICCGLLLFILLRAAVSIIRAWSSLVMAALINVQWKMGLFSHLIHLPLVYFERRKLGDIQSRFSSLDALRTTFTTSVVGAIMDIIMVLGVLFMMIQYGGSLVFIVIAFTSLYLLIRLLTYNYYRQLSEEALIRDARANSYFMETLYGISTVKMQSIITQRSNHWLNLVIDKINTGIKISKMDLLFGGINTFISACDQVIILWLGASLVINNQMTIGMFVAFSAFRSQFSDRMSSLISFLLQLRMMSMHNERISDIALQQVECKKTDTLYSAAMRPVALEAQNLSYCYDTQTSAVFYNLNLHIEPGESVAITGPSGIGKTTLMKVLCGLFKPESGKVVVDGQDIQTLGINNYHKMISCVMQEDKLFSGSIKENLTGFAETIDEEWMIECTKASYIHADIMKMPMAYETLIGELGEGLSGGQKQRIFIARAIYRKPSILFLDEATSHLDKESEAFISQAIKKMSITRIIIAHRKSTIRSADRVIILK